MPQTAHSDSSCGTFVLAVNNPGHFIVIGVYAATVSVRVELFFKCNITCIHRRTTYTDQSIRYMPDASSLMPSQRPRDPYDVCSMMQEEFFFTDNILPINIEMLDSMSSWGAVVWLEVDPSRVEPWLRKMHEQVLLGKTVVALIPARTNTRAFHEYVLESASELRFVRGRLKYKGRARQAPFASVVAIFRGCKSVPLLVPSLSPTPDLHAKLNVITF
jgi:hypothetical protein